MSFRAEFSCLKSRSFGDGAFIVELEPRNKILHPFQTLYQFAPRGKKCALSNINMILKAVLNSSIYELQYWFYSFVPSWPNKYSKCDLKSCIFGQICSQLFIDFKQICFSSIFHQEKVI